MTTVICQYGAKPHKLNDECERVIFLRDTPDEDLEEVKDNEGRPHPPD